MNVVKGKFNNQKGLTLVELLAAITILAIIVGPMFQLIGQAYTNYMADQRKVKAITIAQQKMEETKLDQALIEKTVNDGPQNKPPETYPSSSFLYEIKTEMAGDLVRITVKVYWQQVDPSKQITFLVSEVRKP